MLLKTTKNPSLNRRTQATVGDGKGNDPGHTTWSTYDGFSFDQLVDFPEPNKEVQLRRTDSGRLLSSEVFSGVTPNDKNKAIQEGRYSYYQTNQRFDTTQVLKFDGQASHSYLYDEFGQLYSVNKNDNNTDNFTDPHNAYTFSGTQWDEETSLNYYGARLYDSWSGTWSTQDIYRGTIQDPMSLHRTAFVNNNPVNFYDPDGFSAKPTSDDSQNYQTVLGQNQSLAPVPIPPTQCEMVSGCNGYTYSYHSDYVDPQTGDKVLVNGQVTVGLVEGGMCMTTCQTVTTQDENGNITDTSTGAAAVISLTKKNGFQAGVVYVKRVQHNNQPPSVFVIEFKTSDAAWQSLGYEDSQHLINDAIKNLSENMRQSRQMMKREGDQIAINAKIREELAEQQKREKALADIQQYMLMMQSLENSDSWLDAWQEDWWKMQMAWDIISSGASIAEPWIDGYGASAFGPESYYFGKGVAETTWDIATGIPKIPSSLATLASAMWEDPGATTEAMFQSFQQQFAEWWDLCTSGGYGPNECAGQAAPALAGFGVGGAALKTTTTVVKAVDKVEDIASIATRASVDDKLARYLLNPDHLSGGSKAKWFDEALGFTKNNADELASQIVFDSTKAIQTAVTEYGVQYNQVISITGANGRVIDVTFAWIKNNDGVIRLVTAIPN